jgi:hypothetical protein
MLHVAVYKSVLLSPDEQRNIFVIFDYNLTITFLSKSFNCKDIHFMRSFINNANNVGPVGLP